MNGEEVQTLNQGMSSKARDEVFSVGSRSGRRRVKGWVVQWAVACGSGASSAVVQEARKSALLSLSYKKRRNKAVCRGREPGEEGGGGGSHLLPFPHHCSIAERKPLVGSLCCISPLFPPTSTGDQEQRALADFVFLLW